MSTKNPRISVTLKPSTSAQLVELSTLTGQSQSALIGDILEGSGPVFDRMIAVLRAAKEAKEEIKSRRAIDLEEAQGRLEKQLGIVMDDFDVFTGNLLDDVEEVRRRARRETGGTGLQPGTLGARRPRRTPLSNRGVRSTKQPKNQQETTTNPDRITKAKP